MVIDVKVGPVFISVFLDRGFNVHMLRINHKTENYARIEECYIIFMKSR